MKNFFCFREKSILFGKLSILIVIGAMLALAACNLRTKWVEYHSDTYQLAFQHPEDWSVEDKDGILYVTNPLGWGIQIYSDTSEYTAEQPKELLEEILSQMNFERIVSEDPIQTFTLNGYEAASKRILFEDEIRMPPELQGFPTPTTAPREWVITVLQEADRQVIILSSQIDGRYRDLDHQIKTIRRSFRFQG
jgi:hypothetical protein